MASELLSSHNEAYWGERKVYMRKTPNTNPIRNLVPNPNPNPNPTPQHKNYHGPDRHHNRIPPPALSDDSSSFKRKPFDLGRRRETGGFVTYNISTYTKKELRDLKRRLVSELEQVRTITCRIESRDPHQSLSRCGGGGGVNGGASQEIINAPVEKKKKKEKTCPEMEKVASGMMSKCGQILNKLMKHKGSEWFNSPVDVVRLNLYDYCQIIKQPMDLGTVKTRLGKNLYPSPVEFADDVRLTFKNALIYNPEGHIVHKFAGQLLRLFESQFVPAHQKYQKQLSQLQQEEAERQRAPSSSSSSSRDLLLLPSCCSERAIPPPSPLPLPLPLPVVEIQIPPPQQKQQPQAMATKQHQQHQRKPKAKDPNKRAMNMEEKEKLGSALANLPQEKAAHVLQIVKKRNVHTAQKGDEVEIDFELMDNETLWELDRLVCNWKKMMRSKMKRQQEVTMSSATTPLPTHDPSSSANAVADERMEEGAVGGSMKKSKKLEPYDEEDVDIIGEELPVINYPSVEIEKADSSSSSSGSSSSSDSESGSSSGSDSDGAESLAPGSMPSLTGN